MPCITSTCENIAPFGGTCPPNIFVEWTVLAVMFTNLHFYIDFR